MLGEAERILETQGAEALTLRAAARAAGVSHTAPAHHFGDLRGLLSELAAAGYRRFTETLIAATAEAGDDPRRRMRAMGRAYVGFARAYPGLFVLMFRGGRLDPGRPALREAIEAARQALREGVSAVAGTGRKLDPLEAAARGTAVWSLVHGFAMLLLDGRLENTLARLPAPADADALLDAVLNVARIGKDTSNM